jgi:formamidopyrimidine-DNA glycosylase
MPELPEAETIRCQLATEIAGATIARLELIQPRTWRHHKSPRDLTDLVAGRRIISVGRRGKALYLLLDGDRQSGADHQSGADRSSTLILRLGMTGLVRLLPADAPLDKPAAILTLSDGRQVRFYDTRTFGALIARPGHDIDNMPEFARYGPEPLTPDFTPDYLSKSLAGRTAKLEDVLMNQHVIAGIGKIYADEICFRAGLRPGRRASGLTRPMRDRLYHAIREVLAEGIEGRGSSAKDESYRDIYGLPGRFQDRLHVYQRTGKPCRSCGATIRRSPLPGGRGLHWCPSCQR